MRIGFDAKRYFFNRTGLGNYSRDLVRILETYYPQNTYLKYSPGIPADRQKAILAGDPTVKLPTTLFGKLFPGFWRRQLIVDQLVKDRISIYHGLSGEIPVGLQQAGIASVVTIHDLIFLRFPELYKVIDRNVYDKKFKYAVQHADRIVAISEQTKADIVHYYGVPEESIQVIYQGCHPAFKISKTGEEISELRTRYNLPQHFVLNVGSIEPRKNAFQLVKAMEGLDYPLLIIGKETKYAHEIQKYIVEHGLQNRILIRQGFSMEELSTIYAMADVFVYPSKYEGFGIPIIEALYAGTPVITSRNGVFPEAGGPHSRYVDPDNLQEMRQAIEAVVSDASLRSEMVSKGADFVRKFDDQVLASQWQQLYQSLL